jgi:hypothetical protein
MKREEPELVTTGGSYTVKYKGRFLYSSKNPTGNVLRLVSGLTIRDKTLVFVPGVGLGYGLKELLEKLPPDCHILCVEADQKLMNLCLREGKLSGLTDKRLVLIRTAEPDAVLKSLSGIGMSTVRRVQMVALCAAYQLEAPLYNSMRDLLENRIKTYWQNKITTIFMGRLMVKNYFSNLPQLVRAYDLGRLKTDLPLVVAGAGPSLDRCIQTIKRIRTRVRILAADTALNNLLGHGITPDFILSLDAQFFNMEDFISNSRFDIPLICDLAVTPQVVRRFKTVYFFSSEFYELRLFTHLKEFGLLPLSIPPLGSVGIAAVYCALLMTTGPVFLAGLDFGYPGRRTHAKNTYFHTIILTQGSRLKTGEQINFGAIAGRPLLTVDAVNGKPLLTDLVLFSYAENLRQLVGQHGDRIFAISPEGADCGAKRYAAGSPPPAGAPALAADVPGSAQEYPSGTPGRILEFLRAEEALLANALEAVDTRLQSAAGDRGELAPEEFEALKAVDYAYFHLPHKTTLPCYTRSLLRHVKAFCHYYRTKIAQIIKTCG